MALYNDDIHETAILQFAQCILKHCQRMERDGLENSLQSLRHIEADARAIEELFLTGDCRWELHIE